MEGALRVIGAGLPRTGTYSLRLALERLLGGTCYHMSTLRERDHKDVEAFTAAWRGEAVDWGAVFAGCTAAVDWPASALWRSLAAVYPNAVILLSERDSAEAWWRSADATVWATMRRMAAVGDLDDADRAWYQMVRGMMVGAFGPDWQEPAAAIRGYRAWNDGVRASAPPARLVEWEPGMGWEPLCKALGVGVPEEPFPHTNTTDEFRRRLLGHD